MMYLYLFSFVAAHATPTRNPTQEPTPAISFYITTIFPTTYQVLTLIDHYLIYQHYQELWEVNSNGIFSCCILKFIY